MLKLKRGDTVQVIKGEDKGKKGRVLQVFFKERRALVEGINLAKKHRRKTQQDQQAGVVAIEAPLAVANLALFCKNCQRPSRVGFKFLGDGSKVRYCKACEGTI